MPIERYTFASLDAILASVEEGLISEQDGLNLASVVAVTDVGVAFNVYEWQARRGARGA